MACVVVVVTFWSCDFGILRNIGGCGHVLLRLRAPYQCFGSLELQIVTAGQTVFLGNVFFSLHTHTYTTDKTLWRENHGFGVWEFVLACELLDFSVFWCAGVGFV